MMCARLLLPGLALMLWGGAVSALELQLSLSNNAVMAREQRDDAGSYALPIGPWASGHVPVRNVAGGVTRQAWRIGGASATTLQTMDALAAQLDAAEYKTLFRCDDAECGGFDFRFALPVLPPPEMFVDLFDYRFLSASRGVGADARHISLLVSRSGAATYIQITQIAPVGSAQDAAASQLAPAQPGGLQGYEASMITALRGKGYAVLTDLDFGTGAAALGKGPFASLAALADYLKADPERRVALVGHTDTVGGYNSNLALSRRRADAVMQRLSDALGVPPAQMEAEGIAYLSPRAPNTEPEGREANRRVEAVLLSGK